MMSYTFCHENLSILQNDVNHSLNKHRHNFKTYIHIQKYIMNEKPLIKHMWTHVLLKQSAFTQQNK